MHLTFAACQLAACVLAARAGVDATPLSRSVKSLERRELVRSHGKRIPAGKHLVLIVKEAAG
jgi:hypothetical protein